MYTSEDKRLYFITMCCIVGLIILMIWIWIDHYKQSQGFNEYYTSSGSKHNVVTPPRSSSSTSSSSTSSSPSTPPYSPEEIKKFIGNLYSDNPWDFFKTQGVADYEYKKDECHKDHPLATKAIAKAKLSKAGLHKDRLVKWLPSIVLDYLLVGEHNLILMLLKPHIG